MKINMERNKMKKTVLTFLEVIIQNTIIHIEQSKVIYWIQYNVIQH